MTGGFSHRANSCAEEGGCISMHTVLMHQAILPVVIVRTVKVNSQLSFVIGPCMPVEPIVQLPFKLYILSYI